MSRKGKRNTQVFEHIISVGLIFRVKFMCKQFATARARGCSHLTYLTVNERSQQGGNRDIDIISRNVFKSSRVQENLQEF